MNWIDIEKEMPETQEDELFPDIRQSERVLAYSDIGGAVIGFLNEEEGSYCWFGDGLGDDTEVEGITHWMPLPEPPKEEKFLDEVEHI